MGGKPARIQKDPGRRGAGFKHKRDTKNEKKSCVTVVKKLVSTPMYIIKPHVTECAVTLSNG